jgi:hypothetical protein
MARVDNRLWQTDTVSVFYWPDEVCVRCEAVGPVVDLTFHGDDVLIGKYLCLDCLRELIKLAEEKGKMMQTEQLAAIGWPVDIVPAHFVVDADTIIDVPTWAGPMLVGFRVVTKGQLFDDVPGWRFTEIDEAEQRQVWERMVDDGTE